ncbi:hypothetical protein D9M72_527530 [compost metagenome]
MACLRGDGAGPLGDVGGSGLRRRHHQDFGFRKQLRHGDGDVPGSRGQVKEECVQVAEVDVGEELLKGPVQHGPAPRDRLVALDEHADGNDFDAVGHRRQDHVVDPGGSLVDAHQCRDREPVHVGVDDADAQALGCHGAGEVDCHGGLAHSALAAGHGEDLREGAGLVERNAALAAGAAELLFQRVPLLLRHDFELDVDVGHSGDRGQRGG